MKSNKISLKISTLQTKPEPKKRKDHNKTIVDVGRRKTTFLPSPFQTQKFLGFFVTSKKQKLRNMFVQISLDLSLLG